jgi:hypothetical protein
MALDSQSQKLASESLENQALQKPESEILSKGRGLRFEEVNEVTCKLTDGKGINAWKGDRSGSYRTTRAVGWLMGIGNGQWVFRYRNRASRPMRLKCGEAIRLGDGEGHPARSHHRRPDRQPAPGSLVVLA